MTRLEFVMPFRGLAPRGPTLWDRGWYVPAGVRGEHRLPVSPVHGLDDFFPSEGMMAVVSDGDGKDGEW